MPAAHQDSSSQKKSTEHRRRTSVSRSKKASRKRSASSSTSSSRERAARKSSSSSVSDADDKRKSKKEEGPIVIPDDDAELPDGWTRHVDSVTSRLYFVSRSRNRTQWVHPSISAASKPSSAMQASTVAQAPLPVGWEGYLDGATGRTYYVHRANGITQWEEPTDPKSDKPSVLVEEAKAAEQTKETPATAVKVVTSQIPEAASDRLATNAAACGADVVAAIAPALARDIADIDGEASSTQRGSSSSRSPSQGLANATSAKEQPPAQTVPTRARASSISSSSSGACSPPRPQRAPSLRGTAEVAAPKKSKHTQPKEEAKAVEAKQQDKNAQGKSAERRPERESSPKARQSSKTKASKARSPKATRRKSRSRSRTKKARSSSSSRSRRKKRRSRSDDRKKRKARSRSRSAHCRRRSGRSKSRKARSTSSSSDRRSRKKNDKKSKKSVFDSEGKGLNATAKKSEADDAKRVKAKVVEVTGLGDLGKFQKQLEEERRLLKLFVIKAKQDWEERREKGSSAGATDDDSYYQASVGEVLGPGKRLEVEDKIGRGVFSSVFRCKDALGGQQYAVKFIRTNAMMRKVSLKEIETYRHLAKKAADDDPDGAKYLIRLAGPETFEHRGHLCMVFNLLKCDLRFGLQKYGQGKGLPVLAVQMYARQILLGLRALRRLNVIHADLKPDNILMTMDKTSIRMIDFGSSMSVGEQIKTAYVQPRYYRAPEVIVGSPYGTAIDMWSLGVTLFELALGTCPLVAAKNNGMLFEMVEVCGAFPKSMWKDGTFASRHFSEDGAFKRADPPETVPTSRFAVPVRPVGERIRDVLGDREAPASLAKEKYDDMVKHFADLVEKMLRVDMADRLAPEQGLEHRFFEKDK